MAATMRAAWMMLTASVQGFERGREVDDAKIMKAAMETPGAAPSPLMVTHLVADLGDEIAVAPGPDRVDLCALVGHDLPPALLDRILKRHLGPKVGRGNNVVPFTLHQGGGGLGHDSAGIGLHLGALHQGGRAVLTPVDAGHRRCDSHSVTWGFGGLPCSSEAVGRESKDNPHLTG